MNHLNTEVLPNAESFGRTSSSPHPLLIVTDVDSTLIAEEVIEELDEMWARAFQHEFDHIEGILFTDKLSVMNKRLVAKKLDVLKKDFAKGRIYRDLD